MNQETLLRICMCYLNTNNLRTEDLCNVLHYEYDEVGQLFDEVCEPIRDKWFEMIDSDEDVYDDDLQELAMKLVMKLNHLCRKIDRGA